MKSLVLSHKQVDLLLFSVAGNHGTFRHKKQGVIELKIFLIEKLSLDISNNKSDLYFL